MCYLYGIGSEYTDSKGYIKLGYTMYPVQRMRVYNTGDCPQIGLDKRYLFIYKLPVDTKKEGLSHEAKLHHHFVSHRQYRKGMYTEWFKVPLCEVLEYMDAQEYRRLSSDEIVDIHRKSECVVSPDEFPYLIEEMTEKTCVRSLKQEFFDTFQLHTPRRIQDELWDIWEKIDEPYKGIVQWPTGTGKTIGMLMLFVISAMKAKQRGEIFRGLLIAPKNDIFDTILTSIQKLSTWGIHICEGHRARLSSMEIPTDVPILILATHASLTDLDNWKKLPKIDHCHYDEVHHITGDEFHKILQVKLLEWKTPFLTGTSATPLTSNHSQHKKLVELFGSPLPFLHRCDIDEAIHEGWIAQPRFGVHVMSNQSSRSDIIHSFVDIIYSSIQAKQLTRWNGGKVIVYLSSIKEVREAIRLSKERMPDWKLYTAVEGADALSDELFVNDVADGLPRLLFACERFREGSDIKGLEMTVILMGSVIGTHIVLQIAGRALRNDYEGKEGWCVIVRPSEEGTTEDDVFDSIVLQIMDHIRKETTVPSKQKIRNVVEKFFGPVSIRGKAYDIEETVHRIQTMYVRDSFERSPPKEKYHIVRGLNRDLGTPTKQVYKEKSADHPKYIEEPKVYFKNEWVSWYHYLGVDTSSFPPTKQEWVRICKERGVMTWSMYKEKKYTDLPENPSDMYEDYTNWDKEFGVEEELIW